MTSLVKPAICLSISRPNKLSVRLHCCLKGSLSRQATNVPPRTAPARKEVPFIGLCRWSRCGRYNGRWRANAIFQKHKRWRVRAPAKMQELVIPGLASNLVQQNTIAATTANNVRDGSPGGISQNNGQCRTDIEAFAANTDIERPGNRENAVKRQCRGCVREGDLQNAQCRDG